MQASGLIIVGAFDDNAMNGINTMNRLGLDAVKQLSIYVPLSNFHSKHCLGP